MKATEKIGKIQYTGNTFSDAYLKGCKDLASFLLNEKITINVEKVKDAEEPTVLFHIFVNLDMNSEQREFCKICKEFHCSFYINEDYNCSRCNMKTFLKRLGEKTRISKKYFIEQLNN